MYLSVYAFIMKSMLGSMDAPGSLFFHSGLFQLLLNIPVETSFWVLDEGLGLSFDDDL